jgi:two-component system sensor histidine kinase RstB
MRRPFLRVYLGVVFVVLLVQTFMLFQLESEISEEANRRVVAALEPGVRVMQHRIGRHGGPVPRRVLAEIASHQGMEAEVLRATDPGFDLSESERSRIRSERLVMLERNAEQFIFAELRPTMYLQLGPVAEMVSGRRIPQRVAQTGGILVLIGGVLFLLLSPFERRLRALATVANQIGGGDIDARVSDDRPDAIGQVARSFDAMAAQVGETIHGQRELLRAVSHELRTPIARLLFLIEDVRDAEGESQRDAKLARCDVSLEEMKSLVDELLMFSRMSGADGNSKLETFALAELLERAAQDARELRADIEVRANLDPMELYANEDLVRRAVGNLLSNAVRHCNSVVSLTITRSDDSIFIVVKDDGAGVPATARERIFEPFAQLDESRQRDAGGAGLGLAIVRRIAEAHGGSVRVGEAKAGGARFVLELPLRPV